MENLFYKFDNYCRVVLMEELESENRFFGKRMTKNVIEYHSITEFDKRDKIAPCGLDMEIKMVNPYGAKMHIHILAGMLEYDCDKSEVCEADWYNYTFELNEFVFRLNVKFDRVTNIPLDIELEHWWEREYYNDGDDADDFYTYSEEDSGIEYVQWVYSVN